MQLLRLNVPVRRRRVQVTRNTAEEKGGAADSRRQLQQCRYIPSGHTACGPCINVRIAICILQRMCSACWSRDFSPTLLSAAADGKGEATKVHSTALLQWKGLPWNAIVIHLFCAVITSSYTCVAIVMHPPTCA